MSTERNFIPYGRQCIEDDDVAAVAEVLRSGWLTQGPVVEEFEKAFAAATGSSHAVVVNSGTAALHAAMHALDIRPGDEVIVPPITFVATANCVLYCGGRPVFADVNERDGLIDPASVEDKITPKTRAVIAVDYAGHPCDYETLRSIAKRHGISLVADACHAIGASWRGHPVGSLADLNAFSFHPVKHITTGEGGMVTSSDAALVGRMRDFRTHGITRDAARFRGLGAGREEGMAERGPWYYEMQTLGNNYRLPDINCALGLSQLRKLERFVSRRREIAAQYTEAFSKLSRVVVPAAGADVEPAWHLYVVQIDFRSLGKTRTAVMEELKRAHVGTQVHYIPVHLQPYYRETFGYGPGLCPRAESFYERCLSLPMFPSMTDEEVEWVIGRVRDVIG